MANIPTEFEVKLHFHYTGEGWTDELKQLAEALYVPIRNELINITNPHIEEANESFRRTNPGYKYDSDDNATYNKYMANYLNMYLFPFNEGLRLFGILKEAPFEFWYNEEDCNLAMYLSDHSGARVDVSFGIADPNVEAALRTNGNLG